MVLLQHLFDPVGMDHQVGWPRGEAIAHHVTITLPVGANKCERITHHSERRE